MSRHLDLTRPRSVVAWAVLCGLVAGLAAAVYFRIAGEPAIDEAIAIEESLAAEAGSGGDHDDGDSVEVGRSTQRGPGLFLGFLGFGAAYGLMLGATAFSLRGEWLDPFRRVLVAGAILAGAVTVAPWFKYPPNPPGVGDPSTASERQALYYGLMVLVGLVLATAAHLSGRLRRAGWPDGRRIALVALAAAVTVGAVLALMPPPDTVIPTEVGATLVWRFRVAALGGNLLLWGGLVVGFAALCAEAERRRLAQAQAVAVAPGASGTPGVDQNSMPFRAEMPLS